MTRMPPEGGVLLLDKPVGPTSHDVVTRVRKVLGERRVGHTGTLDPFASGLLVVCAGPATRLVQYLVGADKEYEARARLGVRTETDDLEGETTATDEAWTGLDRARVEAALQGFVGETLQRPPAFSAKKVGGEAAHRKARRGEAVELEPVPVTVHEIELTALDLPEITFRVRCSSGTYIRALARDVGEVLGTGAHLAALRRTRVGGWSVENAVDGALAEDLPREAWIAPLDALADWPRVALSDEEAGRLVHGQRIRLDELADGPTVAHWNGTLLAVCDAEDGVLRPRRVFPPPPEPKA